MKNKFKLFSVLLLAFVFVFSSFLAVGCKDNKTPISISDDGYWVIDGEKTNVKAKGEKGDQGDRGLPGNPGVAGNGIMNITSVEDTENNKTIYTITYTNGNTYSFEVANGTNGSAGTTVGLENGYWTINGEPTMVKAEGADGVSIVSVTKTGTSQDGLVDTYTIVYSDSTNEHPHTDTFNVVNGQSGTSAYVYIKYADNQPTANEDMKDTASDWLGIYSGTSATAPEDYTAYTWYKIKGADGSNGQGADGTSAYIHIKYADNQPTANEDMKDTASDWLGIYSGTSATAPEDYTEYTWYKIKGADGSNGQGADGTSAYIHIKYADNQPTANEDMKDTASDWLGVYSGTSETAPEDYTAYVWVKIKGEDGRNATYVDYTVTFDYHGMEDWFDFGYNDDEVEASRTVRSTEWLGKLPKLKEGKSFLLGWYVKGTNEIKKAHDFVGADVTLEPIFDLNSYLRATRSLGNHTTLQGVIDELRDFMDFDLVAYDAGFDTDQSRLVWDSLNDQIYLYIQEDERPDYLNAVQFVDANPEDCFAIYHDDDYEIVEDTVYLNSESDITSVYLALNDELDGVTIITDKGLDVGDNTGIVEVVYQTDAYEFSSKTSTIRMNGGKLTINAPYDTVNKYGTIETLNIISVAGNSYHEFGVTAFATITEGRLVLTEDAVIGAVHVVASAVENGEDGETEFKPVVLTACEGAYIPTITRDEVTVENNSQVKVFEIQTISGEEINSAFVYIAKDNEGTESAVVTVLNNSGVEVALDLTLDPDQHPEVALAAAVAESVAEAVDEEEAIKHSDIQYVTTETELRTAITNGAKAVILKNDIELTAMLEITHSMELSLNGFEMTANLASVMLDVSGDTTEFIISGGGAIINDNYRVLNVENGANATIVDGRYISKRDLPITVSTGARLEVEYAEVTGVEAAILVCDGGELVVQDGVYTATDNFVLGTNGRSDYAPSVITVLGGEFNGQIKSNGYIACGIYVANYDTVNVLGGTFNITDGVGMAIRGGKTTVGTDVEFNMITSDASKVSGWVGDNKNLLPVGNVFVIDLSAKYTGYTAHKQDFEFNNNSIYTSLASVYDEESLDIALNSDIDEIILTSDIALETYKYIAKKLTLNLNGHTITSQNNYVLVASGDNAELTVTGNGTITGPSSLIHAQSGARVIVENGTYNSNDVAFYSIFDAELTVENATVNAQEVAILAQYSGSITINGGTFTTVDNFVVGTNGTAGRGGNNITINGGTFNGHITSAGYVACGIYVANDDEVTVTGGIFNITNGCGILARAGQVNVGEKVEFNCTLVDETRALGKVGDSRVVVPSGIALVVDLAAAYPGYNESFAFVNNCDCDSVAIVKNDTELGVADQIGVDKIILNQQFEISALIFVDTVAPGCEVAGVKAHYHSETENKDYLYNETTKTLSLAGADDLAIAPTGHDWGEPTYTWSQDGNTMTITRVCKHDSTHVDNDVKATSKNHLIKDSKNRITGANFDSDFDGNLIIPYGVTEIYKKAFQNNTKITAVYMPSTVTTLGKQVFEGCTNLSKVVLSENLTMLEYHMFYNCPIEEFDYNGAQITKIKTGTFAKSDDYVGAKLTNFELPDTLTNIYDHAFENNSISSIVIPEGVLEVGLEAFKGNNPSVYNKYGNGYYLTNGDNDYYYLVQIEGTVDGLEIHKDTQVVAGELFNDYCAEGEINYDFKVTQVFDDYTLIYVLNMPSDKALLELTNVLSNTGATVKETNLAMLRVADNEIVYDSSIKYMWTDDYSQATAFKVTTDNGHKYIDFEVVMADREVLQEYICGLPGTADEGQDGHYVYTATFETAGYEQQVKDIELKSLHHYVYDAEKDKYVCTICGAEHDATSKDKFVFDAERTQITGTVDLTDEVVFIPHGVKVIAKNAFRDNSSIKYVFFPNTLSDIGGNAFDNCSNLRAVILPYQDDNEESSNRITLGSYAFANCSSLEYIELSDKLTQDSGATYVLNEGTFHRGGVHSSTYTGYPRITLVLPNDMKIMKSSFTRCLLADETSFVYGGTTYTPGSGSNTEANNSTYTNSTKAMYSATYKEGCWHWGANARPVLW